jgi:dipeptidyl aminopeptidase/acylaminoacyl peptidase
VTLQFGYLPQRRYSEARYLAYKSSPVASVATCRSPVLFIHGDDDRKVPFQQTTELVEKLRAQNVAFEAIGTLCVQHP